MSKTHTDAAADRPITIEKGIGRLLTLRYDARAKNAGEQVKTVEVLDINSFEHAGDSDLTTVTLSLRDVDRVGCDKMTVSLLMCDGEIEHATVHGYASTEGKATVYGRRLDSWRDIHLAYADEDDTEGGEDR